MVTFEAQSRMDRAWRTVGIFDDRPSAVAEAERLLGTLPALMRGGQG